MADVGRLPTPPRTRDHGASHLPTPDTVRHPRKRPNPTPTRHDKHAGVTVVHGLPTPQTLPRQKRSAASAQGSSPDTHVLTPGSPESASAGQTTVFLAGGSVAHPRGDGSVRRRPGLTFAQQMGLFTEKTGQAAHTPARLGAGVGMGGPIRASSSQHHLAGHHRADDVWGKLAPPARVDAEMVDEDENPFLADSTIAAVSPQAVKDRIPSARSSPNRVDRSPIDALDNDAEMAEPPSPSYAASPSTMLFEPVLPGPSTPPRPAKYRNLKAAAHAYPPRPVMFEPSDDNPFVAKPGEACRPRPAPVDDNEDNHTIAYVFRGTKRVYANPFMPRDMPFPQADLSPMDADYEMHPNPKPKLLWPTATPTITAPSFGQEDSGQEEEDEDLPVRKGLLFGARLNSDMAPAHLKRRVHVIEDDDESDGLTSRPRMVKKNRLR